MKLCLALIALSIGTLAASCRSGTGSRYENSRSSPRATADLKSLRDAPSGPVNIESLFKDYADFSLDELRAGATNCDDILRFPNIADLVRPWPRELRKFLGAQLTALPIVPLVEQSVFGLYLVDSSVMRNEKTGMAAGIACDKGDYQGLVFLNYDTFVRDRRQAGLAVWQDERVATNTFIRQEAGDSAVITLVHEIFHAIDNRLLIHGTPELRVARQKIMDLSWEGFGVPKAKPINIFALASDAPRLSLEDGLKANGYGCARGSLSPFVNQASASSAAEPKELASDLEYLANDTNFIVPYTLASSAEDFAETLTVYYFGSHLNSWQIRTVFDRGSNGAPDLRRELFRANTAAIAKDKPAQLDKMCTMAQMLFGSCRLDNAETAAAVEGADTLGADNS